MTPICKHSPAMALLHRAARIRHSSTVASLERTRSSLRNPTAACCLKKVEMLLTNLSLLEAQTSIEASRQPSSNRRLRPTTSEMVRPSWHGITPRASRWSSEQATCRATRYLLCRTRKISRRNRSSGPKSHPLPSTVSKSSKPQQAGT